MKWHCKNQLLLTAGAATVTLATGAALGQVINVPNFTITGGQAPFVHQATIASGANAQGMNFVGTVTGISGNDAWASDMRLEIETPQGTTHSFGGYDTPSDEPWAFQGGGSTTDGTYSSPHPTSFPGNPANGQWTLTFLNNWAGGGITMNWTNVSVTILTDATQGACCLTDTEPVNCSIEFEADCANLGGNFLGVGTTCDSCPTQVECPIEQCTWCNYCNGPVNLACLLGLISQWGTDQCVPCPTPIGLPCLLDLLSNWGVPCPALGGDEFIEAEDCGDDTNGGCNSDPPQFEAIDEGDTVCGTVWRETQELVGLCDGICGEQNQQFDCWCDNICDFYGDCCGGVCDDCPSLAFCPSNNWPVVETQLRDTDWYEITVGGGPDSQITWTAHTEFPALIAILRGTCSPVEIIASANLQANAAGSVSACVEPGTYYLFIAPEFGAPDITCNDPNEYVASVKVADCTIPAPSGVSCADAIPASVPSVTNVDTTGFPANQSLTASCGAAGIPQGNHVAFFEVVGDGRTYIADTCTTGGVAEANVAVYCGACANLTCITGASQGPCFGFGQASWCTVAGVTYTIAVWGDNQEEGLITLTLSATGTPGSCTPPNIDCGDVSPLQCGNFDGCQDPAGGFFRTSETPFTGFEVADDFTPSVSGQITEVCWQGIQLALPPWNICPDNQGIAEDFRIRYYGDAGGLPDDGNVIADFTVQPTVVRFGFFGFAFGNAGALEFNATHPPVNVTAGECYWISIQQLSTNPHDCVLLWRPGRGNGVNVQREVGVAWSTADIEPDDRAFCVNISLGDAFKTCAVDLGGACCFGQGGCLDTDGDPNLNEAECHAQFGQWFLGGTCASVDCPTCEKDGEFAAYTQWFQPFAIAGVSDSEAGLRRYDKMPKNVEGITRIQVWGINSVFDPNTGFGPCSPDGPPPGDTFLVGLFKGETKPGQLICEEKIAPISVNTGIGFSFTTVWKFTFDLTDCFKQSAEWISVQRNVPGNDCFFLWVDSEGGNGVSILEDEDEPGVWIESDFNLSLCVFANPDEPAAAGGAVRREIKIDGRSVAQPN